MKMLDCAQKSSEWYTARCGIPTASEFSKIITTKGKRSEQRLKYLYRLAGERVTGISEENYQSFDMMRGEEIEEEARQFYQIVTDNIVNPVGFCLADDGYGSSPDGLINDDGILEIKCPKLSTHVGYLIDDVLPLEYFQQVHGNLLVTGRQWCDFFSYFPGIKPFILRVTKDEIFHPLLQIELQAFCAELETIYQKLI